MRVSKSIKYWSEATKKSFNVSVDLDESDLDNPLKFTKLKKLLRIAEIGLNLEISAQAIILPEKAREELARYHKELESLFAPITEAESPK